MLTNHRLKFVLLLAISSLSGCGGSGGSGVTYTVGGTVSGLSGSGLVLQNNGGDDLEVAGNTFEFNNAQEDGSSYSVTVLTHPTGQRCSVSNGNGVIGGADVVDIHVICKGWGSAVQISSGNSAFFPEVAFDSSGNAVAVWEQSDGTRTNIVANYYTAGSSWGSAGLIESDNTGNAGSPQIAFDSNGNAIAVWSQFDGSRNNIWANRYTAGAGWGSAELIENTTNMADSPQVAIDSNGNALVVWQSHDGNRYNIKSNRYTAGTGWGSEELIESDNTGNAQYPQIAIDGSGNAIAVWYQDNGTNFNIMANRYTSGSGWGSPEVIDNNSGGSPRSQQIAFDSDGNALAVWRQHDGTRTNIWANRYTSGSGWGSAELIEDNDGDADTPQIAMNDSGDAVAVWHQDDGTRFNIWANRYTAANGWANAVLIENDNTGGAKNPQVAIDNDGNASVVWEQNDGTRDSISSNRYTVGSGWASAELIEADDYWTGPPQIAIDADGNAVAVWSQFDGSINNIWSNRFD